MILATGLLLGLALLWLMVRRRYGAAVGGQGRSPRRGVERANPSARPSRAQFSAVAVVPMADCCAAVTELAGKRVLPDRVAALPLPGCDRSQCRCRYARFNDRRDGDGDRRVPYSLESNLYVANGGEERRGRGGRRGVDD